jgi:hypothetical protein
VNRPTWFGNESGSHVDMPAKLLKEKTFIYLVTGHFLLSLAAFLVLYGWGVASQDAETASRALVWLEIPVQLGLLQPLAHWVLGSVAIAWWTWPGLLVTVLLLALNSVAACGLLAGILALIRRSPSGGRMPPRD